MSSIERFHANMKLTISSDLLKFRKILFHYFPRFTQTPVFYDISNIYNNTSKIKNYTKYKKGDIGMKKVLDCTRVWQQVCAKVEIP